MPLGSYNYTGTPERGVGIKPANGPAPTIICTLSYEENVYTEAEWDAVLQDLVDFFNASTQYVFSGSAGGSKSQTAYQIMTSTETP